MDHVSSAIVLYQSMGTDGRKGARDVVLPQADEEQEGHVPADLQKVIYNFVQRHVVVKYHPVFSDIFHV